VARSDSTQVLIGTILISVSLHAPQLIKAAQTNVPMLAFVAEAKSEIHRYLWAEYDIVLPEPPKKKEEPKKEEPPPPPPPPPPTPQPTLPKEPTEKKPEETPKESAPPAAAQAGKVLAADDKTPGNEKLVDFTTGNADTYAGGITASNGKSKVAVNDTRAKGTGVPGGTGTGTGPAAPPPPSGPNLSKAARPVSAAWGCPFPSQADEDDVDFAKVMITVTVRPDGTAKRVNIIADPGHGFGRAAKMCALSQRYAPALDRAGQTTTGTTPPFPVTFTR
jgi:periplasmic protein TonB